METCCVSCKKYTANEYSIIRKTEQHGLMLLSNCIVCGKKKLTFVKNQELSNYYFQMNKIIKKILLTGDKFMP